MAELPQELLDIIQHALPARTRKLQPALARDAWAVAGSLRTATLLDTMILSLPQVERLAAGLASSRWSSELLVIYEPTSEQTLIANRRRLAELNPSAFKFVDVVGQQPTLLAAPPPHLGAFVDQLRTPTPEPLALLQLSPDQNSHAMIPLVGVLLDYPVIYSLGDGLASAVGFGSMHEGSEPVPTKENCLGGVVLTVVCASWMIDGLRHPLLSFSYPSMLHASLSTPSSPAETVRDELRRREQQIRDRESDAGIGADHLDALRVEVEVDKGVKMERFAL